MIPHGGFAVMHYDVIKHRGFTLIELVIVVVVVGIIAVVAMPYFINLQKEARVSALHGLKAAVEFSSIMINDRALIGGREKTETSYDCYESVSVNDRCVDQARISVVYGRPKASEDGLLRAMHLHSRKASEVKGSLDIEKTDFFWLYDIQSSGRIVMYQPNSPAVKGISTDGKGNLNASSGCGLIYQQPYMQKNEKTDKNGQTVEESVIVDYKVAVVDIDC